MAPGVMTGSYDSLPDLLTAVASRYAGLDAFVDGEARLSFAGWHRRALGLAAVLARRGVSRGDVVCLMLPSSIDYAVCYAAVLQLGAVVTGINPRLGPTEVAGILSRCEPVLVIGSGSAGSRLPAEYRGPLLEAGELAESYSHPPLDQRAAIRPSDPAVIVWTSGTTGEPKGAWFDHAGLRAGAEVSGLLSAPFDRRLMPIPFAHAGFMTRVWDQLAYVITSVVPPTPWSAPTMLAALAGEKVTVGQGVPTQWEKLLELPELAVTPLPDLRVIGTGAARVPAEVVHALRRVLDCPVIVRYANTETPTISGTRPDDPAEVLERTVGRAQDGIEIRIQDEDGRELPAGQVGRVATRSPFQMRGYWRDPGQTARGVTQAGFCVSSDLGWLDADGNLTLTGRATEVYIRGGYNVYPLEVENALSAHPGVAAAAVVAAPTPVIGEIGVAFVVPAPGRAPGGEELRAWCAQRLADYKAPDRVELVTELPLTPMMKVDKQALARRAADVASSQPRTPAARSRLSRSAS
jgi:acyl-CoA synthetase (AMP-forming)/AMP-acid ligase II